MQKTFFDMYRLFPILIALILFGACDTSPTARAPFPAITPTSTATIPATRIAASTTDSTGTQPAFIPWGTNAQPGAMIAARGLGIIGENAYREHNCALTTADQQGRWFFNLDSGCFVNGDLVRFVEHTGRWATTRYAAGEAPEITLGEDSVALREEQDWSTSINWEKPVFVAWGKDAPAETLMVIDHVAYGPTGGIRTNKNGEWLQVIQFDDPCPTAATGNKHHPCREYALRLKIVYPLDDGEPIFGNHTTYLPGGNVEMFFESEISLPEPIFVNSHWEPFDSSPGSFFVSKMRPDGPYRVPGSVHDSRNNRPLRARTYADCSHMSASLGSTIAPVTDISSWIVGFGTGPCAGWFVMQSYSEQASENPQEYVWIPGQSIMRVSPETPAYEVMKLPSPKSKSELQLLPLVSCDPVGFWQDHAMYGTFGYQNPMAKLEFHKDLSQVLNRGWIDDFADVPAYAEGNYWRGGFDANNRNFTSPGAHNSGWINHDPDGAFIWRYIAPDKTPTDEPNYGIQIIGNGGFWTVFAELSNNCMQMRGSVFNVDERAGSWWAKRMDTGDTNQILPVGLEEGWPSIGSERQMFPKDCSQALVRTWTGSVTEVYDKVRPNYDLFYHRVFLPDGYGWEWLVSNSDVHEFGIEREGILPPELALPFWWAIDELQNLLLLKEFSNALLGTDGSPLEVTERYELRGCHVLWGITDAVKYKHFDGELAGMTMIFGHDWVD